MDHTTGPLWVEATPVDRVCQQELGLVFCVSSSQLTKVDVPVSWIIVNGFRETFERRCPCLSDRHRPGARRAEPQHVGVVPVCVFSSYQTAPRDRQLSLSFLVSANGWLDGTPSSTHVGWTCRYNNSPTSSRRTSGGARLSSSPVPSVTTPGEERTVQFAQVRRVPTLAHRSFRLRG